MSDIVLPDYVKEQMQDYRDGANESEMSIDEAFGTPVDSQ